ncbi:HD-GYP domain-containing protein [Bacillus sp. BGMRC 2118]|nr:HD-GYP domain-containing protein [Bacillus sp. BGMRC 2118]
MKLVATTSIKPGTTLSKAIKNQKGQVLINEGVPLTERMIMRLLDYRISFVYIDEEKTKDIEAKGTISDETYSKAIQTIENTFNELKSEGGMTNSFVIEKATKQFTDVIQSVLSELKGNEELFTLLSNVIVHDHYIFTHSFNVTLYSLAIGIKLNLSEKQLEALGLGALLHDVGKMLIPHDILLKPGKLSMEEYEMVKKHTTDGFNLLRNLPNVPLTAAHCALQHHERLDGSGYPRGISGDEIHLFGKILAVADVFDAVTTNRVYRQAMLPHEGLEILYGGTGIHFDPKMVEAFRNAVAIYPVGLSVTFNDGRTGIVSTQNPGYCDRPIVRILEENGVEVEPYEVDLKEDLGVMITKCSLEAESA